MTRIGLVSDSHGNIEDLQKAVQQMGKVDLIIHTGDYIEDADLIRNWTSTPVMAVKGNMDAGSPSKRPNCIKTKVEKCRLFITHGHREDVKRDLNHLVRSARMNLCNVAVYGHTHRRDYDKIKNVTVVNPGSCSLPNDGARSFAVMTIDGKDVVSVEFFDVRDD